MEGISFFFFLRRYKKYNTSRKLEKNGRELEMEMEKKGKWRRESGKDGILIDY